MNEEVEEIIYSVRDEYWKEFKLALLKDLPPFMLDSQKNHILNSHENAFKMGCLAVMEGIKRGKEATEIQTE